MTPEYEVRIPKSIKPKFPAICIGCGAPPTTTFRVASPAVGWWSVLPGMGIYAMLTGRAIRVPACDTCVVGLRRDLRLRTLVLWTLIIVGVAIGFWLFSDWEGLARRYAIMGLALVLALPVMAWEWFFPPAVDIMVTDTSVRYTFTNKDYANKFATENAIITP